MSIIDWVVLAAAMAGIVFYGIYKGRGSRSVQDYFSADKNIKWWTIGLSIMATQASAITFLSAPGQAFTKGMGFVQFYFGLPIAMILISAFFIPRYKKLNILTAYEYLGQRFDNKTRLLGAILFLTQRGLAAGFTIYAPALVLSSILSWNIYYTNFIIGVLVIIYTVTGGTKAVAHTHKLQMVIILLGMALAAVLVLAKLPHFVGLTDALGVAGKMGRLNVTDWEFDPTQKYNVWSGLLGGLFLALSYFGTDQSQVQRYLGPQPIAQSRIGLLFNGFVKIPMQFFILLIGVLVFVFYQFSAPPVYFNQTAYEQAVAQDNNHEIAGLTETYDRINESKKSALTNYINFSELGEKEAADESMRYAVRYQQQADSVKETTVALINQYYPQAESDDVNYIFLQFVLDYFPVGVIGLLLACILFASMSSTSSELNALASTTMIDIYQNQIKPGKSAGHYLKMSKWFTAFWGVYAILFAFFAGELGSLIEAVNVLGSLFYGTILGIFLVGFFMKKINGHVVFAATVVSEAIVCLVYFNNLMAYLWLPLLGCALVVVLSLIAYTFWPSQKEVQHHS
ncbi:sodium:solute symporter [bacterium]|nr:sodium:solute symporter [bacterium]